MVEEFKDIYDSLNKNGFMDGYRYSGFIKNIYDAQDIEALIKVLSNSDNEKIEEINLIETLDLIKQKYPEKAEIVDKETLKIKLEQQIPEYPSYQDEDKIDNLKEVIRSYNNIDEVIQYIFKEGPSIKSFDVFEALHSIQEVYPQKTGMIQEIIDSSTKAETYENLGHFYSNMFDLVKTNPERCHEYFALIREQLSSDKNNAETLRVIYDKLESLRYGYVRQNRYNAAYDFDDKHPEHAVEFAELYVETLKSDKNTPDLLKLASELLPYVVIDVPEKNLDLIKMGCTLGFNHKDINTSINFACESARKTVENNSEKGLDLIKQIYDMSAKTGESLNYSDFEAVIDAVVNEDISKAQEFLAWEKNMLDAGHEGNLKFYPRLLKMREQYPELLPQIHDLIRQEVQIEVSDWELFHQMYLTEIAKPQEEYMKSVADVDKSMQKEQENAVGAMLSSFKKFTDESSADFALDMILHAVQHVKFEQEEDHYGINPLGDTYEAVNAILQSGNASYKKGLEIVKAGLENNNHHLSLALDILKTISSKSEYVDECINLTQLIRNNKDSEAYGDRNISEKKAEFLCEIMEKYPEKKDKCLPLVLEMLPTSYEKPKPVSDEDEMPLPSDEELMEQDDDYENEVKSLLQRRAKRAEIDELEDSGKKELTSEEIIAQNVIQSTSELSKIAKSILKVAPEKFAECLPSLQKSANEGGWGNVAIIEISKQLMSLHPAECAELFITCVDKHSYGNYGYKEFADNVLETVKQLIDIKPVLDQETQSKLVDNVHDASYYTIGRSSYFYDDEDYAKDKKVWKAKRNEVYLKMMQSTAFSEETGIGIINKVDRDETKFFAQIITEKLCTPKQVMQILTKLKASEDYDEIAKSVKQNYADSAEVKETLKAIKTEKRNKKIIQDILFEEPAGKKIEALIRLADAVIKTKDDKKINQFKDMLFCMGEEYVFHIDKKAMDWFVNNGKPEDLEALNNLSQLYGIKTDLDEYYTVDPAQNAALRIRFGGEYSEIGAYDRYDYDYDEDGDKFWYGINNPHYKRMLSKAYQDFEPDYSRGYEPSEYNLYENEAFKVLKAHGVDMPVEMLQEAFAKIHMPPDIARELNATDLQHLMINYHHHKEGISHEDDRDIESSKNLAERIKEERRGDRISMDVVSPQAPGGVRSELWKFYAANEQMVEFVSKDWKRMGLSDAIIEDVWTNAEEIGAPVAYSVNWRGRPVRSHYGLDNNLHHSEALRIGGDNTTLMDFMEQELLYKGVNSIILTNNIKRAHVETVLDSEGDEKDLKQDGGYFAINSHDPFHFYDNPCVYLYLKADGKLTVKDKEDERMRKRMMVTRRPCAKCGPNERIVYYGGPRECSCAIMDTHGNVRQASYEFWKDEPNNEKQQKNTVAKEVKMDVSVQRGVKMIKSEMKMRA